MHNSDSHCRMGAAPSATQSRRQGIPCSRSVAFSTARSQPAPVRPARQRACFVIAKRFWRDGTKKPSRSRDPAPSHRTLYGGLLQPQARIFVLGGIEAAGGLREGEVLLASAGRRGGTLGCRVDGLVGG